MNQQPASQNPVLQVFFSDKLETPKIDETLQLSDQRVIINFQEYIFGDSNIKCHYLYGDNITARFSSCFLGDELPVYSIPAQPVVTLHVQVSDNSLIRFANRQTQNLYTERQCRLFWQNGNPQEYVIPAAESDHFTLFFRPSYFLHMADRYPILRKLADQVASSSQDGLDFLVGEVDKSQLNFIDDILREVKNYQVSNERFSYLCECLLLQCMNVPVNVEPRPTGSVKRTFDSAFADLADDIFSEDQRSRLGGIVRYYHRNQLIDKFYEFKQEYLELKADRIRHRELEQAIQACYHEVMGDSADLLAETYFWMAQQLHEHKKRFTLSEHEEQTLAQAIITVCDQCFELCEPNGDQLEFYTGYTRRPFVGDLGMQEFGQILNMFVPDMDLPLEKLDGSRESGAILDQYLQDRLGFKPLSHFTEKGEEDKPPKVVELYHTLMQRMTDEFTITDTCDIKKSDLIRILDHAYQQNDLIMLLLFEIDHMTHQMSYVKSQKFNKISAWVMALEEAIENWYDEPYSNKQEKLFDSLMNVYMQSGHDMKAVVHKVRKTKRVYDQMVPALLDVGHALESQTKKNMFILVAESLIIAATQNPFEGGEGFFTT